jgi:hypothetical protein
MPFPQRFPDFSGLTLLDEKTAAETGWGHGRVEFKSEIRGRTFKIRDDTIEFIQTDTLLRVPDDADAYLRENIGKYVMYKMKGVIDEDNLAFTAGASRDDIVENTFTAHAQKERVDALSDHTEYVLSLDMRVLQFVDPFDCTGLMFSSFFGSVVAPKMVPGISQESVLDKIRSAHSYVQGATLWTVGTKREIQYDVRVRELRHISRFDERFDAHIDFVFRWHLSTKEVYDYLVNPESWQSSYTPPIAKVLNVKEEGSIMITSDEVNVERIIGNEKIRIVARQTVTINGSFHELFELGRFPFDRQKLSCFLKFNDNTDAVYRCGKFACCREVDSESSGFDFVCAQMGGACKEDLIVTDINIAALPQDSTPHDIGFIGVELVVQRRAKVFMVRIVFIMFMLQVLSLAVYTMGVDDMGDR